MIPEASRSQESGLSFVMLCLLFTIRENTENIFLKSILTAAMEKKKLELWNGVKNTPEEQFLL